jgi:hypothetical protein
VNPRFEMPNNLYFGGGGETHYTPLTLAALVCAILAIFVLPRRHVVVPLLVAGLLLSLSTNFVVDSFHFSAFRLLLLAGWVRIVLGQEAKFGQLTLLDKVLLAWALGGSIMFCLLWGLGAVANRLGFLYTTLGSYFLLRCLIRDKADVLRMVKTLVVVFALLAPFLIREHQTGQNALSILGAPASSEVRYGQVRAQGPFLHPIVCGAVGAMMLAPFVALWWQGGRNRWFAVLGVASAAVMTVTSASSTPAMTIGAGLLGLLLWPVRRRLRWLRWAILIVLVGLQFLMNAPVWFLIAHVGNATGGSGWHRATLIDTFIRHVGEWWLYGTRNNADWGYYMWDVDNAFVNNGLEGGLLTFVLFIAVFACAFKLIGNARKKAEGSASDARLIWAIGCAVFANAVAFFGIFYFDQSILVWYGLLAMISVTGKLGAERSPSQPARVVTAGDAAMPYSSESETPNAVLLLRP